MLGKRDVRQQLLRGHRLAGVGLGLRVAPCGRGQECARILQQATACRGALDGFITEVIENNVREHMVDPAALKDDPRTQVAEELGQIVHACLA